jgi:hypothetical protein
MLGRRAEPRGDQEGADLVAVQGGGVRLVVQPRPPDVGGGRVVEWSSGRVVEELFLHGVLVEPGDRAQPPGHGSAGTAAGFEFAGEGLDVSSPNRKLRHRPGAAPAGELAQVECVSLPGQAAVPGQVAGEREPLGLGEEGLDGDESTGWGRGGHGFQRGRPGLKGLASHGPSGE